MKIKITNEMKNILTLSDMEAVKILRGNEGFKEQKNFDWEAQQAAALAAGMGIEVLKYEAEITKNERVWDYYDEGTRDLDVMLTVYAFDLFEGFYKICVNLSSIWSLSPDNREEIKERMYILHYSMDDKR